MKKIISTLALLISVNTFAATDVHNKKLEFVYQLDNEPTAFQFSIGEVNACGSVYYKVKSNSNEVANRKFAITLLALEMDTNFSFHDTGTCEGDIAIVKWVRIYR